MRHFASRSPARRRLEGFRFRYAIVALGSLAVCVGGCGAVDGTTSDCFIEGFKTSPFQVPGAKGASVAAQMSVFSRPRRSSDALPRELAGLRFDDGGLARPARVLPTRSRRLLTAQASRLRLYAVPTTNGNVCWQVTRTLENSCSIAGRFKLIAVDQGGPRRCLPTHIAGIVPDSVMAVHVVVSGHHRPAQLESNGFFLELRPALTPSALSAVVLTLRTGRRVTIDL
jgi:hypothetical protein